MPAALFGRRPCWISLNSHDGAPGESRIGTLARGCHFGYSTSKDSDGCSRIHSTRKHLHPVIPSALLRIRRKRLRVRQIRPS